VVYAHGASQSGEEAPANDLCTEIAKTTKDTDAGVESFYGECCITSSDCETTANSVQGSDRWAENDGGDGTSPPISTLTSRVGSDRSVDPATTKEGPGVDNSPASLETANPFSPTIEVTAFQEEVGHPQTLWPG
jgi:hypothetical protein